jgi:hypothetical protein
MPPAPAAPKAQSICKICGTSIRSDRKYCGLCAATFQSEQIRDAAKSAGMVTAHSASAKALRSQSARSHAVARSAWDPSTLPDWLTPEVFLQKIQPLLANVTTSAIATALGVSWVYASHIRAGRKRPHGIFQPEFRNFCRVLTASPPTGGVPPRPPRRACRPPRPPCPNRRLHRRPECCRLTPARTPLSSSSAASAIAIVKSSRSDPRWYVGWTNHRKACEERPARTASFTRSKIEVTIAGLLLQQRLGHLNRDVPGYPRPQFRVTFISTSRGRPRSPRTEYHELVFN